MSRIFQKKRIIPLLFSIGILLAVGLVFVFVFFRANTSVVADQPATPPQEDLFFETIPGSAFHSPDGTWWGYNQSKIVRFGDTVFTYVIENIDESNQTLSNFVVYAKIGDAPWQKGTSFVTSRPGNMLIDSKGVLHAFVFLPTDVVRNDSIGSLMHYWFPNASFGDIATHKKEIVVAAESGIETANIRVGAAIGNDDTMAIGFGLTTFNPLYGGHSEHVYVKKPDESAWKHLIAGEHLGHDLYYPFVLAGEDNHFSLLPVQDDFQDDGNPNTYDNVYQKIYFFEYADGAWKHEVIVDHTNHELASTRPRLVEQSDLFEDSSGTIHVLYKEFFDPTNAWQTTKMWHLVKQKNGWQRNEVAIQNIGINWVRLFEADGRLYYLGTSWDKAFVMRVGENHWTKLSVPTGAKGIYPYVATQKSDTRAAERYIDVLLLTGEQRSYADSAHYYVRIPKTTLVN